LKVQGYWDHEYPHPQTVEKRTIKEMILEVRERVIDSVRSRLRSDVPLGVYLSGGIDSAAVAGIASHLLKEQDPNARLATFTLAFPGELMF
jgi:asparagine synthase (glutamine-hydrolysing)